MSGTDRFGNPLDPSVDYARGRLLASSADEVRRLRAAQRLAGKVVSARGIDAISVFTGNPRHYPARPEDLSTLCEEWVGPGLFAEELRQSAVAHFGGEGSEAAAVMNRTSAGNVAAVLALSERRPVISLVPAGDRSHASIVRGCRLAGVTLVEVQADDDITAAIAEHRPALVVVTTVTSTLARLQDDVSRAAVEAAHAAKAIVFLDEAYGARLRPVLHAGAQSLALGADLAITNTDKAGLSGPRAGVLAGRPDKVVAVLAKASEFGMEARAPIAAGALRSLQNFDPDVLRAEALDGQKVADALAARFGADVVHRSDLGPMIHEEAVLSILLNRARPSATSLVPVEATSAIGMILLRDHGILTTNTHGQPGGRVSIRLKPTDGAVARVGGVDALVDVLSEAMDQVAQHLDDPDWIADLIFAVPPRALRSASHEKASAGKR